jgi:hypothetical protein
LRRSRAWLLATLALAAGVPAWAEATGEWHRDGLQASVTPLARERVLSFYLARGLRGSVIERYADNCVVLAVLRNVQPAGEISITMQEWLLHVSGRPARRIESRGDWLAAVRREQPSLHEQARIAFEWSQLPDAVDLAAGDSVQGMLSLPVWRGAGFELVMRWQSAGRAHEARMPGLRCP